MINKEDIENFFDKDFTTRLIGKEKNYNNPQINLINETIFEFFTNLNAQKNPYLIEQIELKKDLALRLFDIYSANPVYHHKLTKIRYIVADTLNFLFEPKEFGLKGDELLRFLSVIVKDDALDYKSGDNIAKILQMASANNYLLKYEPNNKIWAYKKEIIDLIEEKYSNIETDRTKLLDFKYLATKAVQKYMERISLNKITQEKLTLLIKKGACLSLSNKPLEKQVELLMNDIDKPLGITGKYLDFEEFIPMFKEINNFFIEKNDVKNIFLTLQAQYDYNTMIYSPHTRKYEEEMIIRLINKDINNLSLIEKSIQGLVEEKVHFEQTLKKMKFQIKQYETINRILNEELPPIVQERRKDTTKVFDINARLIMNLLRETENSSVKINIAEYETNNFQIIKNNKNPEKFIVIVQDDDIDLLNVRDIEKILIKLVSNLRNYDFAYEEKKAPNFLNKELRNSILLKKLEENKYGVNHIVINKKPKI